MSELTPEELEEIKDKLRGGPRLKLMEFADDIGVDYEELMSRARDYVTSDGYEYWSEGARFEGVDVPDEFWSWYELVTGEVVKPDLRYSFFSCSC